MPKPDNTLNVSIEAQFPNPYSLIFKGGVEASYDGSAEVTVNIPQYDLSGYATKGELIKPKVLNITSQNNTYIPTSNIIVPKALTTDSATVQVNSEYDAYNLTSKYVQLIVNIPQESNPIGTSRVVKLNVDGSEFNIDRNIKITCHSTYKIITDKVDFLLKAHTSYAFLLIIIDRQISIICSDTTNNQVSIAAKDHLGSVKIGDGIAVTTDGTISNDLAYVTDYLNALKKEVLHLNNISFVVPTYKILWKQNSLIAGSLDAFYYTGEANKAEHAEKDELGNVIHETYLTKAVADNIYMTKGGSVQPATATTLGVVKVGKNLVITPDGTLSADNFTELEVQTYVKVGSTMIQNGKVTGAEVEFATKATQDSKGNVIDTYYAPLSALSNYVTQDNLNLYVTKASLGTYITQDKLNAFKADQDNFNKTLFYLKTETYSQAEADAKFLTKVDFEAYKETVKGHLTKVEADNTYISKTYADTTFATKQDLDGITQQLDVTRITDAEIDHLFL